MSVHRIDGTRAKWRYTCPNGHASWETTNGHFWCHQCSRLPDADAEFWELLDGKTGERLAREKVTVNG
ncbi:hypothetical protein [Halomicrococcus sp. NG-SE-24]|uniref:hypothetical protein n=1 Tax=unclassified Halomicrococcus TaxID=2614448 RepID=UPI000DDF19F4|nr:hypothetical protein DMJ13_16830 [halophilic archaeon]